MAEDPSGLIGNLGLDATSGAPQFPLLVKLIDARENLSIQVHPDDARAREQGKLGKTEAWYVLEQDPGAMLYLGVLPGTDPDAFQAAAARLDGSSAALMRTIPADVGTTVLIPAGTIHALGAGAMVYEIQQPSDITYRLDDWGRVDASGQPREVHIDAGFAVSRFAEIPERITPVTLRAPIGERHLLAACRYFALERIALPAGASVNLGEQASPSVVTILQGRATIDDLPLAVGYSAVVWSGSDALLRVGEPLVALVATVPSLPELHERLKGAGIATQAIGRLGGSLPDLMLAGR